jgi:hypothetical protein
MESPVKPALQATWVPKANKATPALQATGAKLVREAPKAPRGLKARLDPLVKRDFLVFTAEMATPRALQVTLESRAPKAPSEHEVLLEPLAFAVPTGMMAKSGLKVTLARPGLKVLRATLAKLEHKVLRALKALKVKLENKATWDRPAHKVILAHKVPKEIMARLGLSAIPVPQAPLAVKASQVLLAPTATRAQPDKLAPTVLAAKRVPTGLSVQLV